MNLAVDIVLLPESDVAGRAVSLNATLPDSEPIRLHPTECLPHLSLCMGIMARGDLGALEAGLRPLLARVPRKLIVESVVIRESTTSERAVSSWGVARTAALTALHEDVMDAFAPFRVNEVAAADFKAPPPANEAALGWVRTFETRSSYEHFDPHITLGYGTLPPLDAPFAFRPRSLAACHLGASCTCRAVLREFPLA